jgi:hypothetical protein
VAPTQVAAEAGKIKALHPLSDGPWIFSHAVLSTAPARAITERARENPRLPRGIASQSAKPVLFNDIDRWVLRRALAVVPSALDDDDLSFPQRIEDLPVQQFVAQAHIEGQVPGR